MHATTDEFEYWPLPQAAQVVAPALDSVSVTDPAAHAEHATCDSDECRPGSHGLQLTPPADTMLLPLLPFTTDPAPHSKQSLASRDPDTSTYRPLPHAIHAALDAAAVVLPYRPALQPTHRVLESVEYCPVSQAVHDVAPVAASVSVTLPGSQLAHGTVESFEYDPAAHRLHLSRAKLGVVPASHALHTADSA